MSDRERKEFLFSWKIKHFNFFGKIYCECLSSPVFKVESLDNSEWKIHLFPRTISEDLECRLERQNGKNNSKNGTIAVNFRYQLASSTGVVLKTSESFHQAFEGESTSDVYRLFELSDLVKEILKYPKDTLIFRCYLSNNPVASVDPFLTTGSGCEVETNISCRTPSYIWTFKFSNSNDWSVSKQIKMDNMPIEIIFKYIDDSIHIELISNVEDDWTHHFTCDIELINAIGNEVVRGEGDYEFDKENRNWTFPMFITKQYLEQARCFAREEIRIRFYILNLYSFISKLNYSEKLDLSKNLSAVTDSESKSSISSETNLVYYTHHHLQNESYDKTSVDMKLRVDNEMFHVHKTLLSERSTVFSEMFLKSTERDNPDIVDVNDMETDTLKYFLEYLYHGTLNEIDVEIAVNLLVAAERYQVLSLVTKCSKYLEENLSVTNVCRVLYIADMINHMYLKSYAVEFIVTNAPEILAKSEWSYWIERNSHLATEVLLGFSKKLGSGFHSDQDLRKGNV